MLLVSGSAVAGQSSQPEGETARRVGQSARAVNTTADDSMNNNMETSASNQKVTVDAARKGIVIIERAGEPISVGTVLADDGRILTALSPLTHGNNLDARFSDGSIMRLRVGHTDRAWDLALLVPQNGRWQHGLKPSKSDPTRAGSALRGFTPIGEDQKSVAPARVIVKGFQTLVGGDSELLRDAVELQGRFRQQDLGTPIIDDAGEVVAVVARACEPQKNEECKSVPYGVPVSAIKAFLRTVPPSALPPAPWLGIQAVADDAGPVKGVRVHGSHPQGPAGAAGLQSGSNAERADLIVAVDGSPVTSTRELSEEIDRRAVGDTVNLLVFGNGQYRTVTLTLRPAPGTERKSAAAEEVEVEEVELEAIDARPRKRNFRHVGRTERAKYRPDSPY